jgi:predicted homoserine dehydrogenase-like protein
MARQSTTRRRFLQTAAAGLAAPTILSSLARGQEPPSERITLGFIGVGTMGRGHLGAFLSYPDVQVVAVCDVVRQRRNNALKMVEGAYAAEKAKGTYTGCAVYADFTVLLEREDIDAIVIARPLARHSLRAGRQSQEARLLREAAHA